MKKISLALLLLLSIAGCGGGSGSPGVCQGSAEICFPSVETTSAPAPGIPAGTTTSLANICTDIGQKNWVRVHLDDVYLWYNEIVGVQPAAYSTTADYFYALLVKSRDRFSFTELQSVIEQYFQAGEDIGYGATFVNENGHLRVAYTQPDSSAELQRVTRGVEIVGINGAAIATLSRDAQIAALYPDKVGATNQFQVRDVGGTVDRTVQLSAAVITRAPVQNTRIIKLDNKKIGYLAFTDHIETAEAPLIAAFTQFQQGGVDDVVLDVRYNGGGYLYIASQVASMIGGAQVENKVFEKLQFNARHPEKTNDPNNTFGFFNVSTSNKPLPQLGLKRVFVLTGPNTCSASESIINGLSPHIQVITIGGSTCGKPYGMEQKNNCAQAYFAIEFDGVNSAGQGGYVNGFAPSCAVVDDLNHQLGDSGERLLAAALAYSKSGACAATDTAQSATLKDALQAREFNRLPWRDNRIVNRP